MKDRLFYEQMAASSGPYEGMPGGVTFSGGEPLLQFYRLAPLLHRLREEGISKFFLVTQFQNIFTDMIVRFR